MYVCAPHACLVSTEQKKASDCLGLKLQMVTSCHVGAGEQTQVVWVCSSGKADSALSHDAISPDPKEGFKKHSVCVCVLYVCTHVCLCA